MIRLGAVHRKATKRTPASFTLALTENGGDQVRVYGLKVYHEPTARAAVDTLAQRFGPLVVVTNDASTFGGLASVDVIKANVDAQAKKSTRDRLRSGEIQAAGSLTPAALEARTQRSGTFFEALALAAQQFETMEDDTMSGNISLNVVVPMRTATAAKDAKPRASIGTATGGGTLAMYGTEFGPSKVTALAAVEPFVDFQGRRAFCIVACSTVPASQLRQAEAELRRQLALADNPPTPEPEKPVGVKISRAPDSHAQIIKRRAEAQAAKDRAAKAELARLDKLGQGYVAKGEDVEPDLERLVLLLKSGRIVASSRETRGPLHMLRNALDTNQVFLGPVAEALARAIQAVG